jgi:hypothetical protein
MRHAECLRFMYASPKTWEDAAMSTHIDFPDNAMPPDPVAPDERAAQDDAPPILPSEQNHPFGDAVPAPTEPGLDQPLPPKTPSADAESAPQPPEHETPDALPEEISVPIGDAVPAPTEPGLDQPLPAKNAPKPETP